MGMDGKEGEKGDAILSPLCTSAPRRHEGQHNIRNKSGKGREANQPARTQPVDN